MRAPLLLQAEERAEVSNALHTRYGHRLYAEGEFDEAMAHFGMCTDANPMVLLRLFPSLAPPSLLEPLQDTIAGWCPVTSSRPSTLYMAVTRTGTRLRGGQTAMRAACAVHPS